ncbi:MAG: Stp1/IreP family PP2C-type Ser/Thr phosphatase [Actinobacteria bacterium]|nr:Stp1/IreP family PP2C-type Ser/Thr phosphatase [Actinomycetota bacterium]
MRYAALSDTGRVREINEDSYHADGRLFIVADGMGGHRGGEIASAVAIDGFLSFEEENRRLPPLRRLSEGIAAANRAVLEMAERNPELEGMGTTFTTMLVEGGVFLGHVGDSRAYMWRDGDLRLVTRDHSLVERMVREGYISPSEARHHPQRNVILRALGIAGGLEIDLDELDVRPGDRMLLCSDGLSGCVEDDEIESMISAGDLEACCRSLVEAANARGGPDNITVVLVELGWEAEAESRGGAVGEKSRRGFFGRRRA